MRKVYVNEYTGDVYEDVEECKESEERYRIEQEKAEAAKREREEKEAKVDAAYDKAYNALKEYIEVLGDIHSVSFNSYQLMMEMLMDMLMRKDEDDD